MLDGKRKRVAALGCIFAVLLTLTYIETGLFISSAPSILGLGGLIAPLIFAHNSLAATVAAFGMFFLAKLVEAMPARFRRREPLKHPRLFSAAFAAFLVFNSLFRVAGANALNVQAIPLCLPIAAIEVYGLYLASLTGLLKCISAKNMAKVCAVFLVGAIMETLLIIQIR